MLDFRGINQITMALNKIKPIPTLVDALPAITAAITLVHLINSIIRRRRRSKPLPFPHILEGESTSPDLDLPHQSYTVWIRFSYFFILLLSLCQAAVLGALLALQVADEHKLNLSYVGVQGASIFSWVYISIISLLLLTHVIHPLIALPPLQWFYGVNSILTWTNFYVALPILSTTKLEDWSIEFTLHIIPTTIITTLLLILVFNLPVELDHELVIHTGFSYTSKDHGLSSEASSSLFGWWIFSWVNPLIRLGSSKTLEIKDIPELVPDSRARFLWSDFLAMRPMGFFTSTLYRRVIYYNLHDILWEIFFGISSTIADFIIPYFLNQLLRYIQNPAGRPREEGYLFVILIFLTQIIRTILQSQMFFLGKRVHIRVKAILNSVIYEKALRRRDLSGQVNSTTLKDSANEVKTNIKKPAKSKNEKQSSEKATKSSTNTGKIVNLMSQDTIKIAAISTFYPLAFTSPIGIFLGGYLLFQLLGWSCIIGLLALIVTLPLTSIVRKEFAERQRQLSAVRDERVNATNELVQGIRMVKFFAWERPFISRVLERREYEILKYIRVYKMTIALNVIWSCSPVLVTLLSFIFFTKIQHGSLDAATAFTAILLFDRLKSPLNALPSVFVNLSNARVAIDRIEDFLAEPDVTPPAKGTERTLGIATDMVGLQDVIAQWHAAEKPISTKINSRFSWFSRKNSKMDITDAKERTKLKARDETQFMLKNINILFPLHELSIICGPTGSGKTSLLHALLGELDFLSGQVYFPRINSHRVDPTTGLIPDGIAYVAQTAWLRNASIRDNILFGSPYEEERYQKVLECCALNPDLSIFEDGDLTEIGEKGITLSGGQKQRVSLARAVYSRAAIVLLDDCLSAVDSHTAKHIVDNCLFGDLMHGRTRILVTHHVKLCLVGAKFIVRLDGGHTTTVGHVQELRETGRLKELLEEEMSEDEHENIVGDASGSGSGSSMINGTEIKTVKSIDDSDAGMDVKNVQSDASAVIKDVTASKKTKKLIKDELKAEGHVKLRIYRIYFAAAGGFIFWISVLALFVSTRGFNVAESIWVKEWASAYDRVNQNQSDFAILWNLTSSSSFHTFLSLSSPNNHLPESNVIGYLESSQKDTAYVPTIYQMQQNNLVTADEVNINYYLVIYCLISILSILMSIFQMIGVIWGSLRASRHLYKRLLEAVSRAPLRFFDTTPVGRIMNRFTRDFATIDNAIAQDCMNLMVTILYVIAIVAIVTFIMPLFLTVAAVISIIFFLTGRMYINSSRELKRMDSVSKSPIFSQFGETIIGISTIRAFGLQNLFMQEILKRTDYGNRPFYWIWNTNRWLSVRSDLIGATVALSVGTFVLMNPKTVDAALAGLVLNYALSFVTQINSLVRQYTMVEMDLNSVERVNEYLIMPMEPPAIIEPQPSAAWPSEGIIEVKDLVIQYAPDLDNVIRGITFDIRSREKVGIIGRTGSGKSTLALSLFRFVDPSEGHIRIDGVDITSIGVEDLRSRLTIIPQDPVLFSGTLRSNLDPLNEHDDAAIWESLNCVHLTKSNKNSTTDLTSLGNDETQKNYAVITSLDNPVSEGGNNFSAGQKQLLCLSRALLRNSKIIVMDEATASVDFETDSKIQSTIREEFANSTLLCIAHRLRTIIDYDRILVLDHGEIAEFDSPYNLLFKKESSIFRDMCEKSGEVDTLMEMVAQKGTSNND